MSPNYTNDHCCQIAHTLKGIANKQSKNKAAIKQDIDVITLPLKLGVHHRRGDKKVLRADTGRKWSKTVSSGHEGHNTYECTADVLLCSRLVQGQASQQLTEELLMTDRCGERQSAFLGQWSLVGLLCSGR